MIKRTIIGTTETEYKRRRLKELITNKMSAKHRSSSYEFYFTQWNGHDVTLVYTMNAEDRQLGANQHGKQGKPGSGIPPITIRRSAIHDWYPEATWYQVQDVPQDTQRWRNRARLVMICDDVAFLVCGHDTMLNPPDERI